MKTLFVVTHPQAVHHLDNTVGGWHDTPLSAQGRRHAHLIAEQLHAQVGTASAEIFTSDLLRAAETAAVIGAQLGQAVHPSADLREISYGVAGGKPQAWLDARRIPPAENRLEDRGGIEGAESRREIATRIYRCMDAILSRPAEIQIIVTHGFALTFVIASWIGMPLEAAGVVHFAAGSGSITHLEKDRIWKNRSLVRLANVSHLSALAG